MPGRLIPVPACLPQCLLLTLPELGARVKGAKLGQHSQELSLAVWAAEAHQALAGAQALA